MLGKINLIDLRTDTIQKFVNALLKKKLSARMAGLIGQTLYQGMQQALLNGLIQKNVAANIKYPKIENKEAKVLTIEEQKRLIDASTKALHGELFILILATGLRIGEALALTWEDIDFEEGVLRVNKTKKYVKDYNEPEPKYRNISWAPKTRTSNRSVPLLPNIKVMLKVMLKDIFERQLVQKDAFSPEHRNKNLVFYTYTGNYLDNSVMSKKFAQNG